MQFFKNIAAGSLGLLNKARLGFPQYCFTGAGGIGDDLLCTTVFHEIKKRNKKGIIFASSYPTLFENNQDVDFILRHPESRLDILKRKGFDFVRLSYANYDGVQRKDTPPPEHILATICRIAGLTGKISLRPYLYLTKSELEKGKFAANHIIMQSSGLASRHPMLNKEWHPKRFQEVCTTLAQSFNIIQLGSREDPKLEGALDLRGKTSLRQSASIMANSTCFVGLVGFLMHLARAVDCRSVIIYGGRENPNQTGYIANKNLYSAIPCSPCWLYDTCDYDRKCMSMISSQSVADTVLKQLASDSKWLKCEEYEIK